MSGQRFRTMPMYRNDNCPTPSKRGYETRRDAKKIAHAMRDQGCNTKGLGAYKCGCGLYHVGHLPEGIRVGEASWA